MNKILHITGYMGDAGIGKAISGMILNDKINRHSLFCLEYSSKRHEIKKCIDSGIDVTEEFDNDELIEEIKASDVVIIHWWDYPPVNELIANFPNVSCRLLLWCHVNGVTYPLLPYTFLNCFEWIFFTSPVAYENKTWSKEQLSELKSKSDIVYGLADVRYKKCCTSISANFKNGLIYAGTFTKSKIYPDFTKICKKIIDNCPDIEFVMLGEAERGEWIRKEAVNLGIDEHFRFLGFVDNVYEYMEKARLFFYPLNPFHFGTTENVMLEAMSVGLPIVAMNQLAEKYIVINGETGILAGDTTLLVKEICELYNDLERIESMGLRSIQRFNSEYSMEKNVVRFDTGIKNCMTCKKGLHEFKKIIGDTPHEWFESFVPNMVMDCFNDNVHNTDFPAIFTEETKSSVRHFRKYFPEDTHLQKYESIIKSAVKGV